MEWKRGHMFSLAAEIQRGKASRAPGRVSEMGYVFGSGGMSQGSGVTGPWACSGLQFPHGGNEVLNVRNCEGLSVSDHLLLFQSKICSSTFKAPISPSPNHCALNYKP